MVGEEYVRALLRSTVSNGLASVAPVFRREHELPLLAVVVAIRPSVVTALLDLEQLLRGKILSLFWSVQLRPVVIQLVAPVLRGIKLSARIERDSPGVTDAGRVAL